VSVLITGGTGFIGAYTARRLIRQDRQVVTLDNLPSNVIYNLFTPDELEQVRFVAGAPVSLRT